jgi:hypothetical protein
MEEYNEQSGLKNSRQRMRWLWCKICANPNEQRKQGRKRMSRMKRVMAGLADIFSGTT